MVFMVIVVGICAYTVLSGICGMVWLQLTKNERGTEFYNALTRIQFIHFILHCVFVGIVELIGWCSDKVYTSRMMYKARLWLNAPYYKDEGND